MPNTYAIAYAPNLSGGAPANTTNTGSFYIGNMNTRVWNQVVPQTTTNTLYFSSPLTSSAYIMAIPNPKDARSSGIPPNDQPQFYNSMINGTPTLSDAAFIFTCDYILKNYDTTGRQIQYSGSSGVPASATGCNTVVDCQNKFTVAGWFQNYGFNVPA